MKPLGFIALLSVMALFSSNSQAQVTRSSDQRDWLVYYAELANYAVQQASEIDPELRQDYELRVTEGTAVPSAMVIYRGESGGSEIHVNHAFILMSLFLADIYAANSLTQNEFLGCAEQYVTYLQREVARSIAVEAAGGKPNEILPPEDVAFASPECNGIEEYLPLAEQFRPQRDILVGNALGFVILHEIGHIRMHKHVQVSNDLSSMNKALSHFCVSRSHELQADRFAVRKLFELGWADALHYTPIWHLLSVTDPITAAAANERWILETTATHPFAGDRMAAAYDYMFGLYESNGLTINHELKALVEQLTEIIAKKDFLSELSLQDLGIFSLDLSSCS